MARILQTGITLIQTLDILSTCQSHPKMVLMMNRLQWDLQSGSSLAEALANHPRWFDPMVCALIHLGERSGSIPHILEQISLQQSKHHAIKQQLTTLIIYPTIVISMAVIVTVYLLITVMPELQTFFQNAHQPLPSTTLLLIHFANWLKHYGFLSCFIGMTGILYLKMSYRHSVYLQQLGDRYLLRIPGIGHLCRAMYLARAFHALAIAQRASLPLPDGLQWIALITGNFCYKQAFFQIRSALQQGESLRSAIVQTKIFPELVVQILSLGEESGTLSVHLEDLAQYYSQMVDDALQRLSRGVEPVLMIILGLVIGSLILSIYLPMIQLGALL